MNLQNSNISSINVAHLTSVHAYDDVRIFYKELLSLMNAGFNMTLIAPQPNTAINNPYNIKIVNVRKANNRFVRMIVTVWKVYKLAQKEKAKIYHLHDPELLWIGLLLSLGGAKVIYDAHEHFSEQILDKLDKEWLPQGVKKIVFHIFRWLEFIIGKRLDYIITATPEIKNYFINRGINNKSIDVNNYPDLEEYKIISKVDNKNNNQVYYAGDLSNTRGIKQMILAMDLLDDVQLILAGNFASEKLKKECSDLPGWNKVKELGFVGRDKVISAMQQAKVGLVLLHPVANYFEARPIKLFEYMAAGIPIIASDFPLWRSLVVDNNCGICVDPLDIKAIANAIRYIIDSPNEAKIMGHNGRQLVLEKFNWDNEAKKLIDTYKEILAYN